MNRVNERMTAALLISVAVVLLCLDRALAQDPVPVLAEPVATCPPCPPCPIVTPPPEMEDALKKALDAIKAVEAAQQQKGG